MHAQLSTHVLDTAQGKPAQDLTIRLYRLDQDERILLKVVKTNSDGRCTQPLLSTEEMQVGSYELIFEVENYLRKHNMSSTFLKEVVVRFHISDATQKYHVPLLLSPFGYSTYRGS